MIRDQWYIVLESSEISRKPIGVTRMGEKLVFWRNSTGNIHCAVDRCVHRGVALSKGTIIDDHLQCPFHGFEYDPSGTCVHIPANGRGGVIPAKMRLTTYPTFEEHGYIWIWWGEGQPQDTPAFFDNIDDTFYHASARDPWEAHYSRVIENQLDVVHLPFIHRNTIGRGNRTVVDGPVVEWKGEKMLYTYVFNRVDDGTPPRKPSELSSKAASSVHLEFIMPNLWQNYISPQVRILAAFVPVDDEHIHGYKGGQNAYLRADVILPEVRHDEFQVDAGCSFGGEFRGFAGWCAVIHAVENIGVEHFLAFPLHHRSIHHGAVTASDGISVDKGQMHHVQLVLDDP